MVRQKSNRFLSAILQDLGGQTSIRPYWRCYYANTDAIIYVVDSCDKERMGVSKEELVSMLEVSARSREVSGGEELWKHLARSWVEV